MSDGKDQDNKFFKIGMLLIAFIIVILGGIFVWNKYFKEPEEIPQAKPDVTERVLEVEGLTEEHILFFMADSHISLCDDRDPDLTEKAKARAESFKYNGFDSEDYFKNLIQESLNRRADVVILGGDIIDSAMYASIDVVKEQMQVLKDHETFGLYYCGNHDFEYGSEYYSQVAYDEYLPRLSEFHAAKSYRITEYDDLVIFAADDENNQISEEALEAFKEVMTKGKPVVLCLHVPLEPATEDTSFVEICKTTWGADENGHSRVSIGPNGCYMNETTQEFRDLVLSEESPVVLVLGGHVHFFHEDELNERTIQIVTGAAFEGKAVEVTLKPASN